MPKKTTKASAAKSALGGTKTDVEVLSEVEGRQTKVIEKTEETQNTPVETEVTKAASADEATKVAKAAKIRGKKYQAVKKLIDVTQLYPLTDAVKLVQKVSLSKFDGKVEAHLTVFDIGNVGEIVFPHLESATKKVVVLNDTILANIKDGKIDFDILIATPATMGKLLPLARVLGPRGLMPNPKSGTLTDKPEEALKRLSVAKTVIKTEKKAPVIHLIVGKVSQPAKELIANVEELIKVVKASKIKKLVLCPTMGPSVKVEVIK